MRLYQTPETEGRDYPTLTVIDGGRNVVCGARNSTMAAGRPDSAAIFMPGFCPEHAPSMGGVRRYKALRGTNKPACPSQVSSSPRQGGIESYSGGAFNASMEGFDMAAVAKLRAHSAHEISPFAIIPSVGTAARGAR